MFGKRLLFLLVFVLLGQFVFSEKLELNAKKLSANVSVLEEQLDLKVVRGPDQDYSSEKKFGLVIGGCDVKIVTVSSPSLGIMFYISVNGGKPGETVNGWNGIAVTTSVLKFTGIDSNGALSPKSLPCDISFEAKDDNFMIELELTGSVPLNFKLTSDAELYEQKKEEVSDGHLKTGIYVGLIVLGIVFLAASSTIAGFLIRRRQKKNKVDLAEEKANTKRLNDAKLMNEKIAAEAENSKPVEAQKDNKKGVDNSAAVEVEFSKSEKSKTKKDGSDENKQSKVVSTNKKGSSKDFSINTADLDFGTARVLTTLEKKAELREAGYDI